MAATLPAFRSALHGFNRTDVVQFIQSQTAAHEKSLRLLREEITRLEDALNAANEELAACKAAAEAAAAEASAAEPAPEEAPAEPEAPAAAPQPATLDAPMAPPVTVVKAAAPDFDEMELAAYRRAELTERMARERAASSAERMRTIFAQADEKLSVTSHDLKTLLDSFQSDFAQMQQLLETAQGIVDESSSSLKAASDICAEP